MDPPVRSLYVDFIECLSVIFFFFFSVFLLCVIAESQIAIYSESHKCNSVLIDIGLIDFDMFRS